MHLDSLYSRSHGHFRLRLFLTLARRVGFLSLRLERREVALEELATGVSSGGGEDVEGAGLKLCDSTSEIRKDENAGS